MHERIEEIRLDELRAGDVLSITTGVGSEAFLYDFTVLKTGNWPVGYFQETDPSGSVTGSDVFMLQGSGIWTTRQQNPVQTQETAFSSSFDSLAIGSFMVASSPESPAERFVFDSRGQEISSIRLISD